MPLSAGGSLPAPARRPAAPNWSIFSNSAATGGWWICPATGMRHWGQLLQYYFENRRSLGGLLLVVDIRRRLKDFDRQMIEFAQSVNLPTHVLLTKSDKLKRGQAAEALRQVREELAGAATVQLFSAQTGTGCDEARDVLQRFLATSAGIRPGQ